MIRCIRRLLRSRIFWSSLLLLLIGGLWIRDLHQGDVLAFCLPGGQIQGVGVNGGEVTFFFSNISLGARERGLRWDYQRARDWEYAELRRGRSGDPHHLMAWRGFEWSESYRDAFRVRGAWYACLTTPHWVWLLPPGAWLLFSIPPSVRRATRERRNRRGLCVRCGYDIRHSGERCSECGEPVVRKTEIAGKPHTKI